MFFSKQFSVLLPIVLLAIVVSPCCASISLTAQPDSSSCRASSLNVSKNNSNNESRSPKQVELQNRPDVMGTSMTGSNSTSLQIGSSSVLAEGFDFYLRLRRCDQVCITSWKWRPTPPCDELLKIPKQS